ncbi:SDR family NAD(P)-dependent oxidoreductase [Microbacterium sp. gxy059]|uniref:SDR family NAD(P)-dependent oxidoreductase n=1 Tax=Microbacterium sp. gxy059 TaxID=2957199 RepID=UPI003D98D206
MAARTVLITGGTRGIGRACARDLAAAGCDLVLGYASDEDAAAETASRVRDLGARCLTVRSDLTDDAGIDRLFDEAIAWAGSLDGVVNNAGATMHIAPLAETPVETIRRVIDLNLTSAILVARRAVRDLRAGGVLVNISSRAARTGSPGEYVHYAAAKAGVDALTTGLAREVAPRGIRVVGVAPGVIETDIHADAGDPERPRRAAKSHPSGRIGQPEEVAAAVAFALSEGASYVSGTTILVAGGA